MLNIIFGEGIDQGSILLAYTQENWMKKSLLYFVALVVLMVFGPASAVKGSPAVVGEYPPPAGATIYPGAGTTQVRMLSETVEINAAQNDPGEKPYARVRAVYTMRNLGSAEENLPVRFPLNFQYPGTMTDWQQCEVPRESLEIGNFSALVDGQPAQAATITKKISDPLGKRGEVEVACWANFTVRFPPAKDVQIEVRYTAQGFSGGIYGSEAYVQFHYVLTSGAAWKGTTGHAEIIFHAPYEFNKKVLLPFSPETGTVQGSEIRWEFNDFEPDRNITVSMMDPSHWQLIQDQTRAVNDNPQDGAAWGRLAESYKAAVKVNPEGWRSDEGGYEMFATSATAYARAVSLSPADADLRYGYAELLIWDAFYPNFGRPQDIEAGLVRGVENLRRALAINPKHVRANALLKRLAEWKGGQRPVVDLSGPTPVYLVLTPGGANYTPAPTRTRTPFPPSLTPSPTWTRAPSRTPTATAIAAETQTLPAIITIVEGAAVPEEATATPESSQGTPGLCGAVVLPAVGMVFIFRTRKRGRGHGSNG